MPKLYYILIFILTFFKGFAQDLCNTLPAGAVSGSFDVSAVAGCSPFTVNITDKSGGTNIKYYYEYQGGGLAELATSSSTTATSYPYLASTDPIVFTILQVGQKGGKEMYACKNVTVRPNSKPVFSAVLCNNNLELVIPNVVFNDFDNYKVSWTGLSTPINIQSTQIPFEKIYITPTTVILTVEGFYSDLSRNCGTMSSSITLDNTTLNTPSIVNIDKVQLLTKQTAEITFSGSFVKSGYDLYVSESNGGFPSTASLKGLMPGSFKYNLPDTSKSFCFTLLRSLSCGSQERSVDVCTTPILELKIDGKQNVINWINHKSFIYNLDPIPPFLGNRNQTVTLYIRKSIGNTSLNVPNRTTYTDINCKEKVCYQLITNSFGNFQNKTFSGKSISNEICVDRKDFHPPAITDAFVSVNNSNKVEINYSDNSGWTLNKNLFRLQRENTPNFVSIDSTTTVLSPWLDVSANPDNQSNCYRLNYTDECGSTSIPSPTFCTTYLSSTDNKTLDWTLESPFASSPFSQREIIFIEETSGQPTIETTYSDSTITSHTPDLNAFEEFAVYQIKTTSASGKESFSNTFKIPIEANVFFPTAFSPNNDGKNDKLEILGHKKRIVTFELTITSRWGERVFYTKDKEATWDGTFKGESLPSDIYHYTIFAETNTGEKINKKGYIWLLK